MKKTIFLKNLTDYITQNRLQFFFTLLCLLLGTVIGSLSAVSAKAENLEALNSYINNFVSAYTIQSVNRGEIFRFSIYNNIKTILFMWVSGLWIGLVPLSLLQMGTKGYKLGFTSAFLVQLYRGKGIIFSSTMLIPQALIVIPTLTFYTVFNINFAFTSHRLKSKGQTISMHKDMYIKNLIILVTILLIFIVCSLIDTFVIPTVLKAICSFLIK